MPYWPTLFIGALVPTLQTTQSVDHLQFIDTPPAAVGQVRVEFSECELETKAFAQILVGVPDSLPVSVQAVDSSMSVLFATTSDAQVVPRLIIDLSDVARLPSATQVRTWAADSSWAWTRCEVLAHELAETLAYRELWRRRPGGETVAESNALFGSRVRQAHFAGLAAERLVAGEQRTRIGTDGKPYSRARECFVDGSVHVIFGDNTQTVVMGGSATPHFVYYFRRNMCGAP